MKRLLFSIAFCVTMTIGLLLLYPSAAFARPCQVDDEWYYSDDSCTEQVGRVYVDCNGHNWSWGTTTSNFVTFVYCCGNTSCDAEGDGCGSSGLIECYVDNCPGSCYDY